MKGTMQRVTIKRAAILAVMLLVGCTAVAQEPAKPGEASTRPNVLFIAVDDLKPVLGCYGDTTVKSPNIDRLAARGTTFTRAYCMQAVCAPSRNAVLTGLRPGSLQIYNLATNFRKAAPDVTTLPQLFKNSGWQSHGVGKIFHVGHGNTDDTASWSVPLDSPGTMYALKENRTPDKEGGRGPATEIADVPDNAYADGQIADIGIERLRKFNQTKQPFFLAIGFIKPHLPFAVPKKYWDLYDRNQFHLPERQTLPDDAPTFAGHSSDELRIYSDIPDVGPINNEKALELLHGYHASVSYTDKQIGRVLDELDRLKLTDNTIIILWGDHGWHLGDHGLWCKHSNYEQATRAPLIIDTPGDADNGRKCDQIVEFVDIYPTLCHEAGITKPAWLQGKSLKPLLADPRAKLKNEAAFQVYPRNDKAAGKLLGQSVRTDRWRLVEWQRPDRTVVARELYDYQNDPDETANIADRPANEAVIKQLSAQLKQHLDAPRPAGLSLRDPTTGN